MLFFVWFFLFYFATISSVARGGGGGSSSLPHWHVKYAKSHVFGAFEADILWKFENSPPTNVWISDFGRKISLNFGEDPFESPILAEKSVSISVKTFFFYLETTWFWAEKTFELPILAEKSVSISVKTFLFFFLETTWFWAEKTFEFPSFPRNSVLIFGQTVWNWFKNNENSGQGCLHFSHSFKKAPLLFQILATRLATIGINLQSA